jgi:hypothetical protein
VEVTENESSSLQYEIDFGYLKKKKDFHFTAKKKVLSSEVVVTSVRDLSVVKL